MIARHHQAALNHGPDDKTAADLMTPNVVSIRDTATMEEAIAFLTDTGSSPVPVLNEAGQPVGVLSRTDIVEYDRERLVFPEFGPLYFETADLPEGPPSIAHPEGAQVRDLMTPALFSVPPEASALEVAQQMIALDVHRLFVIDTAGVLLGAINGVDLLRHLCP